MTPAGVLTTLYSFTNGSDGGVPVGTPIQATDGNFYGTTRQGGSGGSGTIFKITPAGVLSVLHAFNPLSEGPVPTGVIQGADGNLYGTTEYSVFKLTIGGASILPPSISSGGVVPLYSSSTTIQPGEFVSIYGTNLASGVASWTGNFPMTLGGTSVTIDGNPAYLLYVSPGLVNLQAPDDTAIGTVSVVVTTANGSATSTVTLGQFAPSLFLLDGKHVTGIIVRSDGSGAFGGGTYDIIGPTGTSLGYPTVAAKAGDIVELFGTGFEPTSPAVAAGQAFSGAAETTSPVQLLINGVNVNPSFAGLSGAGLDQINLTVPAGIGTGDVPLLASVGGLATRTGVIISLQ
jgi:uncharacterized protein (TIGR03437 family)